MDDCSFLTQIGAFHDGELSVERRSVVEQHLSWCGDCARELARLEDASRLFGESARAELSPAGWRRLRHAVDAAMDRGLSRLAWTWGAAAAGILVAGSIWLATAATAPQAAPPWVGVATADSDSTAREAATPAAAWYLQGSPAAADQTP